MPLTLKGSCHCGIVHFSVQSHTPVPFMYCLCSICRKFGGFGGSSDIHAIKDTLEVQGKEFISTYNPVVNRDMPNESVAKSEWNFCSKCASGLWLYYPHRNPDLLYIVTSAVDTPLPTPPEIFCVWTDSRPDCSFLPEGAKSVFRDADSYPTSEDWHREHDLFIE